MKSNRPTQDAAAYRNGKRLLKVVIDGSDTWAFTEFTNHGQSLARRTSFIEVS